MPARVAKSAKRVAKSAKRAAQMATITDGRGQGHARGHGTGATQGKGQGHGQGHQGRAGTHPGGLAPFPMDLVSASDDIGSENNKSVTQMSHPKHSTPSNASDEGNDDNIGSSGSDGVSQQVQPKPHPIARISATAVLGEGSGGPGVSTCPCCTVHAPIPYGTRKI